MTVKSLQDTFAKDSICFGCGPKNELGLQIKSFIINNQAVADFLPKAHHQAFLNVLCGGICGSLLDCHSNWAAAYFIMKHRKEEIVPCTVTANYSVKLLSPTPITNLKIIAEPVSIESDKAIIKAYILAKEKITATCEGLFVAVREGHPAFHRW